MGRIQAPRRIGKVDTLEGRASKLMLCVRTKVITCAGKAKQRLLVLQGTARIYFKLLSTAAMVDSLAEKADECPLNWGHQVFFACNWDHKNCQFYRIA